MDVAARSGRDGRGGEEDVLVEKVRLNCELPSVPSLYYRDRAAVAAIRFAHERLDFGMNIYSAICLYDRAISRANAAGICGDEVKRCQNTRLSTVKCLREECGQPYQRHACQGLASCALVAARRRLVSVRAMLDEYVGWRTAYRS